ncbi:DUF3820 family protein [Weeksellaceae bacterium KMM 9713]|uniref:DUF3820 family protein n=1 Tax=Profundicola chukchiensis TaxID=2961959 RepID=A0A9X4MZS4_9FLAO|nr:DUF3820 family protein [Profundicola chukchiensis]MDG4946675.1 DUF3820 family protein [Profundicola chukchiensis]MDG4949842.1 DUF3820 family protein [Profundicola chukchiensis]
MDKKVLLDTVRTPMPFGKYKGKMISDLPISYLEWFQRKGFPPGKLGMLMSTVFEIKTNGLDEILYKIKQIASSAGRN